jgi:glycosyltransferase involved in cell wall biosynthesis
MRVTVVHNHYRSTQPSGENRVVEADMAALRSAGVEVVPYQVHSDSIERFTIGQKAALAVRPLYSPADVAAFGALLDECRPDIAHVHNVYPLLSPAVVRAAARRGIPVVQTVHNFRHRCVSGIAFRNGSACSACFQRGLPWPAVVHGCYQGSTVRSIPMAVSVMLHRSTWRLVDRFLVCGAHVADFLRSEGIDASRIEVRPNTVADPGEPSPLGTGVLFAGRLVEEKGIGVLLDAWGRGGFASAGHVLRIAGDGPLRRLVEEASSGDSSIEYLGLLDNVGLDTAYRGCALVVVPSLYPEPDPIAVVSALAHGRAVVATNMGSITGTVGPRAGWIGAPDARSLADTLSTALSHEVDLATAGAAARQRYLETRHPRLVRSLVDVYREVLDGRSTGSPPAVS